MKTVNISSRAKTVNALLKMARRKNIILRSTNGEQFILSPIQNWEVFDIDYIGDDFDKEVKATVKNKKLMNYLADRKKKNAGKPRYSIKEVRKELGLE